MKPVSRKLLPSKVHMPFAAMSATYQTEPSGEIFTSCGIEPLRNVITPSSLCDAVSTLSNCPENSHDAMKYVPSGEKSAWFTPEQGTERMSWIAIVCGSRKTI